MQKHRYFRKATRKKAGGSVWNKLYFILMINSAFLSWTAVKLLKEGNDVDVRTIPAIIGGTEKNVME